jgi:hypothetical protein
MSAVLANREIKPRRQDWLAEGAGFEPAILGVKQELEKTLAPDGKRTK